jgi:hypothetical protein
MNNRGRLFLMLALNGLGIGEVAEPKAKLKNKS